MTDFFETETKLREALQSATDNAREICDKLVSQAQENRDKAIAAAQSKFDGAFLKASQDDAARRAKEVADHIAKANAEAGLDKDGKEKTPPVKPAKKAKEKAQ